MARRSTGNAATFSPAGRGRSRKSRQPIAAAGSSRNESRNAPTAAPRNTAGDGNTVPAVATRKYSSGRHEGSNSATRTSDVRWVAQFGGSCSPGTSWPARSSPGKYRGAMSTFSSGNGVSVGAGGQPSGTERSSAGRRRWGRKRLQFAAQPESDPATQAIRRCAIADVASNWKTMHKHARFRGRKSRSTKVHGTLPRFRLNGGDRNRRPRIAGFD